MKEAGTHQAQLAHALGCIMCNSLYVKANGELPCWCDAGEELVLRKLNQDALMRGEERQLFDFAELVSIRQAFLEGRDPYPDVCSRCAMRGHGVATVFRPKVMEVLHVEPSFLCHLACPQCVRPDLRPKIKDPPHNMPLDMFENILIELQAEGVKSISTVSFEGRGDPMMNAQLGEMVTITKSLYPDSFAIATTHGNYPFKRWLVDGGLDVLRLSIDGAYQESYEKYRVGGNLRKALELMRRIRDERSQSLRVEWKYILFKWNDSDDEIREAARLSDELGVRLRFCLTHSPGKSERFQDLDALQSALRRLAPKALQETTFQLKSSPTQCDLGLASRSHYVG